MARIIIDPNHPAAEELKKRGIEVSADVSENNALRLGILNFMPTPINPVVDFGVLLSRQNHDIQIIDLGPTPELITTNPDKLAYRQDNILPISNIGSHNLDAALSAGAAKESAHIQDLRYFDEFVAAHDSLKNDDIPVFASCWSAQAGLEYFHGVERTWDMDNKLWGVIQQTVIAPEHPLMRGIGSTMTMPVSRNGRCNDDHIRSNPSLSVLAESAETGTAIVTDGRILYVTGHPEYNQNTLPEEHKRDSQDPSFAQVPTNVFEKDDPTRAIKPISWEYASGQLIANWTDSVHERKIQNIVSEQKQPVIAHQPRAAMA